MGAGRFKHAFSAEELYTGLKEKILKTYPIKRRNKNRKQLAANIFKDCFFEILLDIINNNVTFVLPTKFGEYGEICMEQIADEEFKEQYKQGRFKDIDFVKSQFTGNQLVYKYKTKSNGIKKKNIYVNKEIKNLINKYTHENKQYY